MTTENTATSDNMAAPIELDLSGLLCPLPVLKLKKRMGPVPAGTRFLVTATDPAAAIDIPHYCHESGNRLLAQSERNGALIFEVEKASPPA